MLFLLLLKAACGLAGLWLLSTAVCNLFFSPLRNVPGPFFARISKLWYFIHVYRGQFEHENIELHRKYGPIVRVAPNMYSIDIPDSVNTVYHISSKMPKSSWYEGWKHPSPDRWTLFPDRDMKRHALTRRRFQYLYSMSSLITYEGYSHECADLLQTQLRRHAAQGKELDLGHWLQCYAFDVIGNITYSQRFGFLDNGDDVSGIMKALHSSMIYSTMIGILPALHPYVFGLMAWLKMGGGAGRAFLMSLVQGRIQQRREQRGTYTDKTISENPNAPQDFLEKLLIQNEDDPTKVTAYHIFMMGLSNIIAGADTTAISLSAVFYYLIKSPNAMRRLRSEVDEVFKSESITDGHLAFKEANNLPYLQAVIKEAMRLHAATGLPLWRVVSDEGVQLNNTFFPAGCEIGLNTWVAHYNTDVFGNDAAMFRPERWTEEKDDARLKLMNSYYLPVR